MYEPLTESQGALRKGSEGKQGVPAVEQRDHLVKVLGRLQLGKYCMWSISLSLSLSLSLSRAMGIGDLILRA